MEKQSHEARVFKDQKQRLEFLDKAVILEKWRRLQESKENLKAKQQVIQDKEEAQNYDLEDGRKLAYVTQTTLSVDDTKDIIEILKKRYPDIKEPSKDDICYATTNRQMAVKNIAKKCDMFFVIGSRNSSNSVRLVEVAKNSGCEKAYLVHSESEVPYDDINKCSTIGISSGASAPDILVDDFINQLKQKFSVVTEEIEIIKENVIFKVPNKLN